MRAFGCLGANDPGWVDAGWSVRYLQWRARSLESTCFKTRIDRAAAMLGGHGRVQLVVTASQAGLVPPWRPGTARLWT
jgi:hypothetical protein